MRKGKPSQFMSELEDKIKELKGIDSSAEVVDDGTDYIEAGCHDEEVEAGCHDEVEAGCHGDDDHKKVSAQEVTCDEEVEEEEVNETLDTPDGDFEEEEYEEVEEDDHEDYLNDLYGRVEDELADLLQGVSWGSDEENIFMDVSFSDGHVITFTIPREDLVYDLENPDVDVKYICTAVRDSQDETEYYEDVYPEEEAAEESMEDLLDDYDIPAYL